jgi:hypothetical protein
MRLQTQFTIPLGTAVVRPALGTAKPEVRQAPPGAAEPASPEESAGQSASQAPIQAPASGDKQSVATATFVVPSATLRISVGPRGYQANVSGSASEGKVRDLAYAFGLPHLEAIDDLTGGTTDFDLAGAGPWIASTDPYSNVGATSDGDNSDDAPTPNPLLSQQMDVFSGTLRLHHAQWKAAYLARPADLPLGTITMAADAIRVNADFVYGTAKDALKGTVTARVIPNCKAADCDSHVQLHFGALDASVVQAALLGPPEQKSILSPLVDRMRGAAHPQWPALILSLSADSLVLGPAQMLKPTAQVHMDGDDLVVDRWEAGAFGGTAHGSGRFSWTDDKPSYSFAGEFAHLNPSAVATVLGTRWKDGLLDGKGQVKLLGLNQKDLASSADGEVQFQWVNGSLATTVEPVHFSSWNGIAMLRSGRADLGKNTINLGSKASSVTGAIPYGGPARLTLSEGPGAAVTETARRTADPSAKPSH